MNAGHGPEARDAQHLVVALDVAADDRLGVGGNPADAAQRVSGRRASVLIAQGRGNLWDRRHRRLFHRRQREDGLAADFGKRILQFLRQCGHGVLGGRAHIPQHEARPVRRLIVLQGHDQAGHGLGARLGNRIEDANLHPRVRILEQFDAQGYGDLRPRVNMQHCLDDLTADRFIGVLDQFRQGGNGRLCRRTDLAHAQTAWARTVAEPSFNSSTSGATASAAFSPRAPNSLIACNCTALSADFKLPMSVATESSAACAARPPNARNAPIAPNKTNLRVFMLTLSS